MKTKFKNSCCLLLLLFYDSELLMPLNTLETNCPPLILWLENKVYFKVWKWLCRWQVSFIDLWRLLSSLLVTYDAVFTLSRPMGSWFEAHICNDRPQRAVIKVDAWLAFGERCFICLVGQFRRSQGQVLEPRLFAIKPRLRRSVTMSTRNP